MTMKLREFVAILYSVSQFLWHHNRYPNEIRHHYHIICLTVSNITDMSTLCGTDDSDRLVFLPISSYTCGGQRSDHGAQPILEYSRRGSVV
jgi:hypothetical protein